MVDHIHTWESIPNHWPTKVGNSTEVCKFCGMQREDNGETVIDYPEFGGIRYDNWLDKSLAQSGDKRTSDGIRLKYGNYVAISPEDKQDIAKLVLAGIPKQPVVINIQLNVDAERTADFLAALTTLCDEYLGDGEKQTRTSRNHGFEDK